MSKILKFGASLLVLFVVAFFAIVYLVGNAVENSVHKFVEKQKDNGGRIVSAEKSLFNSKYVIYVGDKRSNQIEITGNFTHSMLGAYFTGNYKAEVAVMNLYKSSGTFTGNSNLFGTTKGTVTVNELTEGRGRSLLKTANPQFDYVISGNEYQVIIAEYSNQEADAVAKNIVISGKYEDDNELELGIKADSVKSLTDNAAYFSNPFITIKTKYLPEQKFPVKKLDSKLGFEVLNNEQRLVKVNAEVKLDAKRINFFFMPVPTDLEVKSDIEILDKNNQKSTIDLDLNADLSRGDWLTGLDLKANLVEDTLKSIYEFSGAVPMPWEDAVRIAQYPNGNPNVVLFERLNGNLNIKASCKNYQCVLNNQQISQDKLKAILGMR